MVQTLAGMGISGSSEDETALMALMDVPDLDLPASYLAASTRAASLCGCLRPLSGATCRSTDKKRRPCLNLNKMQV